MTNLRNIAEEISIELAKYSSISKIILFGSVARNEATYKSDIDLAVILDPILRGIPLDFEGYPISEMPKLQKVIRKSEEKYKVKIHLCPYWEDEYEEGIGLYGTKYPGNDSLNGTGITLYDWEKTIGKI